MRKVRERRERLSGEERRAQIIDAALKLFADKGFSGTRTREIAELAGIADFGEIGHRSRSKPATFSVKPATSG